MGRKSVPWPPNFSSSRKRKRKKEKQRQPWTCRSQSTPQPGDPRRAQRHLRGTSLSPFLRSHLREFARAALPQQRTLAGSDDSTPGGWPVAASSGLAPSRAPPAASGSSLASARPLVFAGITSVAPGVRFTWRSPPAHLPPKDTGHVGLGAPLLQDELILTNHVQ